MPLQFPKSAKYNFNKNLAKRYRLVTHLDRFLATEPERFEFAFTPKEKDDAWHPSGHCTPDPSDLFLYATEGHKEPRDIPVSLQKIFLVGHFWHQLLQWACVQLEFAAPDAIERKGARSWGGADLDAAMPPINMITPKPFHWATGSGDVAPCVLPDGWSGVVDFKTINSFQFKSANLPENFANKYEAQINIYMDWFDCENGLIVGINKENGEMKEWEFERNQDLIDAIYEKWEFVSECVDRGVSPTAEDDEIFDLDSFFTGPVAQ